LNLAYANQVTADLILVGGGLANCLIALRLNTLRPEIRILILERSPRLGGNHTWSFHDSDVTSGQRDTLKPLVEKSWPSHDVHFPQLTRTLSGGYNSIVSERLHDAVSAVLGDRVLLQAAVKSVGPESVTLEDGRRFAAPAVIDGRGDGGNDAMRVGFQKFLGQIVTLDRPHGLSTPLLMDATVEQRDGFRFFYLLPFSHNQLLIEDTRYSTLPDIDQTEYRREIATYSDARGWRIANIEREEEGVLPVVMDGDIDRFWSENPGVPRSGVRAGLFNYTTGYSLAEATRCADAVATTSELTSRELYPSLRSRSEALWKRGGFQRLLNRMLFLAAPPAERYRVLQHFYRLPEPTINRFYAGWPSRMDRVKILSGKPPVSIAPAIKAMLSAGGIGR
jgi:lycopene beta-cyclase